MNLKSTKYAARTLLDRQVPFPGLDPRDPDGSVVEVEQRLGTLIPDAIFDLLGDDAETVQEILGTGWEKSVEDFDVACRALKQLATSGRVDEDALLSGADAVKALLDCVTADANSARAMLAPDSPISSDLHKKLNMSPDQISNDMRVTYSAYLGFRCAQEALEILRDGLLEINKTIGQGPPPRSRR